MVVAAAGGEARGAADVDDGKTELGLGAECTATAGRLGGSVAALLLRRSDGDGDDTGVDTDAATGAATECDGSTGSAGTGGAASADAASDVASFADADAADAAGVIRSLSCGNEPLVEATGSSTSTRRASSRSGNTSYATRTS